ncbi:hypothetical protein F5884DRAFT_869130 [Xylogone sp. PMI_703]|nr:hypothetical protein F5884DRAFT_869130 [Xylogone sp. PMI_703]
MGSRSLNGCWTCRLRRKKCDEMQPSCLICKSSDLCCDGYGGVPSWKDGHLKESQYLAMVKSRVKENFRRRCQLRSQGKRLAHSNSGFGNHSQVMEVPNNASTILFDKPAASISIPPLASSDPLIDIESDSDSNTDMSSTKRQQLNNDQREHNLWNTKARELELVMYYIDSVFYIQFRFYSSASVSDRRGWLYVLLHEVKPFYNACISLSSYADALLHSELAAEKETKLRESNEYVSRTLTELHTRLQSQLQDATPSKDVIATVMCIIQLLSLEV